MLVLTFDQNMPFQTDLKILLNAISTDSVFKNSKIKTKTTPLFSPLYIYYIKYNQQIISVFYKIIFTQKNVG